MIAITLKRSLSACLLGLACLSPLPAQDTGDTSPARPAGQGDAAALKGASQEALVKDFREKADRLAKDYQDRVRQAAYRYNELKKAAADPVLSDKLRAEKRNEMEALKAEMKELERTVQAQIQSLKEKLAANVAATPTAQPVPPPSSGATSPAEEAHRKQLRLGATLREWLPSKNAGKPLRFVPESSIRNALPDWTSPAGERYVGASFHLEGGRVDVIFKVPAGMKVEHAEDPALHDCVSFLASANVTTLKSVDVFRDLYGKDSARADNHDEWREEETERIFRVMEEKLYERLKATLLRFDPRYNRITPGLISHWAYVRKVDESDPDSAHIHRSGDLLAIVTRGKSNRGSTDLRFNPPNGGYFTVNFVAAPE